MSLLNELAAVQDNPYFLLFFKQFNRNDSLQLSCLETIQVRHSQLRWIAAEVDLKRVSMDPVHDSVY